MVVVVRAVVAAVAFVALLAVVRVVMAVGAVVIVVAIVALVAVVADVTIDLNSLTSKQGHCRYRGRRSYLGYRRTEVNCAHSAMLIVEKYVSSTVTNCSIKVGRTYQRLYQHFGNHLTPEVELMAVTKIAQSRLQTCDFPNVDRSPWVK